MTVSKLLIDILQRGVELFTEAGELRYQAPKGTFTPELRQAVAAQKAELIALLGAGKKYALPSFAQERLWFLDQLEPGGSAYTMPSVVRLEGSLDSSGLEASLREIARRHEALRTTFPAIDGRPVQVIDMAFDLPFRSVDLRHLSGAAQAAEAGRITSAETLRSFNLAVGPLFYATLLRLDEAVYQLILSMHHIITDGWSLEIMMRELATLYEAHVAGQPSPLPELPLQYAAFARWQRQHLQGETTENLLAYWKSQLGGELPALQLPGDFPRPQQPTYAGAACTRRMPDSLTADLAALSQREGVTPFMALLAIFALLLGRQAGQEDIAIGVPIANRNRSEIEHLIGFFVNTLVLRATTAGNPSFSTFLHQVREVALGAYRHQDLPFEHVVEALRPARDQAATPLFQVFFNMLPATENRVSLSGLTMEFMPAPEVGSKFDLTLYARERSDGMELELLYNSTLFSAERAAELLEQFVGLLRQALEAPERPIDQFSLLTKQAVRQLPDPSQPLEAAWEGAIAIHVARQAQRVPNRVALIDQHESWTYEELDARSNQLAHYLRANGVASQSAVAIYGQRSAALVWALLGVLKAGAAFVVLDPALPAARLLDYMKAARPSAWIQTAAAGEPAAPIAEYAATMPCRLALPARRAAAADTFLSDYPASNPGVSVGPDDRAYIAFTSGSTGAPKGIVGSHRPLSHFLAWHTRTFSLSETDRFSLLSGVSHDPALRDIFTPLWLGATLCIPDTEQIGTPGWLDSWLRHEQITVAHLTPAMGHLIANHVQAAAIPSLHRLFFGGDVLRQQTVDAVRKIAPEAQIVNFYGATETPQAMGYAIVQPAGWADASTCAPEARPSIGRGIEDVQLLVLNATRQLAGLGEVGEIYIRTPYLSLGYLGDDPLTSERFITNPYTQVADDRLYRTGDLGRFRPDGTIEFLGRNDQQVKIRGYRIELGELEAALGQHPAVRATSAQVWSAPAGDLRLVSYVSLHAATAPGDLRAWLKARLPEYMLPAHVVVLDALPLTPNGKIDRRALPAPDDAGTDAKVELVAPATPAEHMLVAIWREVLKLEQVSVRANFFELGGHSLLATQVISRIREQAGIELPLRSFFAMPTITQLAAHLEQAATQPLAAIQGRIPRYERPLDALPLSFSQQRLWFLEQFEPGSSRYNIAQALHVRGQLNLAALRQVIDAIVARHATLRTSFATIDGEPVQQIASTCSVPIEVLDLSNLPADTRLEQARQQASVMAQRPFDLAAAPLLQIGLIRLGADEHLLVLTLHHIISDGWSTGVLIKELVSHYTAVITEIPTSLPELPVQYSDYAIWQREQLQPTVFGQQLDYWKTTLADMPPVLELPTDRPRPPIQTYRGAHHTFQIPSELCDALTALSQREGATLFMTLLAGFNVVLQRYTGQHDLAVGTPIASRNRQEIEHLIGFFVNTLVLRTDLADNPSFREALQRVREAALGAFSHQDLPFEALVEALQPERNLSHSPLFQVMFVLQNAPLPALELPGLSLQPCEFENRRALFDLTLILAEAQGGLAGTIEYNADLFDAATIERLAGHLQVVLESVENNPSQRLGDIPLLTSGEHAQLITEWNQTAQYYPTHQCIHHMFEARAIEHPAAVAVTYAGAQLTYGELNRRANQLARHLRQRGVGPQVLVGICVERSLDMLVGILGILKAGGAYVPLDPAYPSERLAFMLDNTQAPVLLTQQRLIEKLPQHQALVVCLDTDWELIGQEDAGNLAGGARPEHPAYIIFTSGSTGKPKGVVVRHQNLVHSTTARCNYYEEPVAQFLLLSSYAFDSSVAGIFWTLSQGGTLCLPPDGPLHDLAQLGALIKGQQITHMLSVPSFYTLLLEHAPQFLGSLRTVIVAGEACPRELVRQHREALGATRLFNEYGPTEGTVWSSVYECTEPPAGMHVPIGRPIANVQMYILNEALHPAPVGVPGEIYIGGEGLAAGYLNRPDLTAERFVANPFTSRIDDRLYRTGDLGRFRPDGTIEFLGRNDQQVKIRGYRIELGELEAALGQHPAVRATSAQVWSAPAGDLRLVSYVSLHAATAPGDLRAWLKARLPEYMLPAHVVVLDALPLTPNGKIDRRALPAPEQAEASSAAEFVAPRTPTEQTLAAIWSQILGVEQVGIHDNFFELGGNSLLVIRVIARANQAGVGFSPKQIFQHQTIAELAPVAGGSREILADQNIVTGPVPFTSVQRWFLSEKYIPNLPFWNTALLLESRDRVDAASLSQAVEYIFRHHDVLRMALDHDDQGWRQWIEAPGEQIPFTHVDLRDLDAAEQTRAMDGAIQQIQTSFNLATGPLFKAGLFDLGPDAPSFVLLVFHVMAAEATSWQIVAEDLQTVYWQLTNAQPAQLPAKTTSFKQLADHMATYAQSEELRQEYGYWLAETRNAVPRLPVDFADGENTRATLRVLEHELEEAESQSILQAISQAPKTHINDVLLAGLGVAFGEVLGVRSALVDVVAHSRNTIFENMDLSRTVGWFSSSVPLLLSPVATPDPLAAVAALREQRLTMPNQGIGYDILRYLSSDAETSARLRSMPKSEVVFAYLGNRDQPTNEGLFSLSRVITGHGNDPTATRIFLLEINLSVVAGRLRLQCGFSSKVHHETTIQRLLERYADALRDLAAKLALLPVR